MKLSNEQINVLRTALLTRRPVVYDAETARWKVGEELEVKSNTVKALENVGLLLPVSAKSLRPQFEASLAALVSHGAKLLLPGESMEKVVVTPVRVTERPKNGTTVISNKVVTAAEPRRHRRTKAEMEAARNSVREKVTA